MHWVTDGEEVFRTTLNPDPLKELVVVARPSLPPVLQIFKRGLPSDQFSYQTIHELLNDPWKKLIPLLAFMSGSAQYTWRNGHTVAWEEHDVTFYTLRDKRFLSITQVVKEDADGVPVYSNCVIGRTALRTLCEQKRMILSALWSAHCKPIPDREVDDIVWLFRYLERHSDTQAIEASSSSDDDDDHVDGDTHERRRAARRDSRDEAKCRALFRNIRLSLTTRIRNASDSH